MLTAVPSETIGRETFNKDYPTVWEKRALQTGKDSLENHRGTARERRKEANGWMETRDLHGDALFDLGVSEEGITPVSSWGSGHRSG
jgi:hypothetical protein